MENLAQMILNIHYDEKNTGEMERQLIKLVSLEEKFVEELSDEKRDEYFNLDNEKGVFHIMEVEQVIRTAIKVLKEIYK